jgi:glycosyltransferase involved in cell wall biosynthesis
MKISVITPTYNRPEMLKRAVRLFHLRAVKDVEMIVIGPREQYDLLAAESLVERNVRYIISDGNIGKKRNLGCEAARAPIIMHCDDDDWYAEDWLVHSASKLLYSEADCVGLRACYFNELPSRILLYQYTGRQGYAVGATLCYWKDVWEENPFPEIQMGEDTAFVSKLQSVLNHDYTDGFCALLHGGNTCSHKATFIMKELKKEEMYAVLNKPGNEEMRKWVGEMGMKELRMKGMKK